jgi:opacity protein-like surface antigen
MKKIISIVIASMLFSVTAYAGGMIGIKAGYGELDAKKLGYTAGGTTYAAQSTTVDSGYGAIFAEIGVGSTPFSLGVERVPLDAVLSVDGNSADSSLTVSDMTTLYALGAFEVSDSLGVFVKAGYVNADIGSVKTRDGTTVNKFDDSLEGPTFGAGIQLGQQGGFIGRLAYEYTDFDQVAVTTTSNGSASVTKKAETEVSLISISVAKSF